MFGIEKNGQRIGFAVKDMSTAVSQLQQYIEDHVQCEAGQLQQRLWHDSKMTIAFSEAQSIVRDTMEEQLRVIEL